MNEQSSNVLGLPPAVWVAIIAGLAGALAATQHPFQDVRPDNSGTPAYRHAPSQDQDIEARQWEDPFSAVAAARRTNDAAKSQTALLPSDKPHAVEQLAEDVRERDAHVLVIGAMVPGAPYADDIETRRRTRYAVLAGLYRESYVPDDSEHIGYVTLPPQTQGTVALATPAGGTFALPMPAAGTVALAAPAGGTLAVPTPAAGAIAPPDPAAGTAHTHEIAAYEWLHFESPADPVQRPRILLLWLDQDGFQDRPLARFSSIVNAIGKYVAVNAVAAAIIGPARSDGLKAMRAEVDEGADDSCQFLAAPQRDIAIYSPRATAPDWLIVSDAVKKRYPDTENDPRADHFHDRCAHLNLYRTVASDFTVARALYKELEYRGVQNVSEIALITERDTLYARLISRYFNGCRGTAPINDRFTVSADDDNGDSGQPLCFTYLRGLDGLVPPAPDNNVAAASSAEAKPGANTGAAPAPTAHESADGQGQLDYLRRLTAALASIRDDPTCGRIARILALGEPSEETKNRCGHQIKAIGIIGSDIYDKLLVLQALRRAFPRYTFFTTDLDARWTDAQNLQWTHEMVIGSSLGLSLRPELQGSIPPFRDSFQTTTYFSTMQAVRRFLDQDERSDGQQPPVAGAVDLAWTRRPHVFEIGRAQAFDLSVYRNSHAPCDKAGNCKSIAEWRRPPLWSTGGLTSDLTVAVVVVLIAIFMAGAAMGTTWVMDLIRQKPAASPTAAAPRKRLIVAVLSLTVAACVGIVVWNTLVDALTNGGARNPTPIFSGANHWSASIVEALSILLVVTLVIRGQRKLNTNAATMLHEFGFPLDGENLARKYRVWLRRANNHRRWSERLWFPIRRLSGNKRNPLVAPTAADGRVRPSPLDTLSELEVLIGQYLYRGRCSARVVRVAIATIIASCVLLVLEYALMLLEFDLGVSMVNGFAFIDFHYVERGIENLISFVNLLAIQFLIFWVADALLLTRSFVLALAKDKPRWPQPLLESHSKKLGLCESWTAIWLDLRLIARRTSRVSGLIWYPSLMIAGMAVAALTVEFGELGFASNPIALLISAGFVVTAGFMLRRAAEAWRSDVIFQLEDDRLLALGTPDEATQGGQGGAPDAATKAAQTGTPENALQAEQIGTSGKTPPGGSAPPGAQIDKPEKAPRVEQIDRLTERVRALGEGAFAPYSQQPLVRAVLVPAITYGATVGLQFLHLS